MIQQRVVLGREPQFLHREELGQMHHVLFEHLPRKEYHQKEAFQDSPATSFLTPCLDGAT
ncbi:Uncharacterised protein [Streptococcus pneumoniae]|nr:Uncharacterised protein [Streptococcus pneumoniae]CIV91937.1 Uncharacterised protein [Streptococcus pneumoniae]CJH63159.1 Uncharacterised protein [Streptococcus pneumoniae]CKM84820.1 Uncharacterised protein [Streptococcus pneumoniae]CMW99870.1 Uncharacterised protein [Streptococcus pneumoniae]